MNDPLCTTAQHTKAHYLPPQLDSDLLDTIGIFLHLTHDIIYSIASLLWESSL